MTTRPPRVATGFIVTPAKPSTQSSLAFAIAVALGADGSLYIADNGNYRIRRVGPDGIVTTVVGNGGFGSSGIALGGDGSLYIADPNNYGIRRVGPDGIITTVAGNDSFGFSGLALGGDGSLYLSDASYHRIRRFGPNGIITTVAGNGGAGFSGDGGPALQASLSYPSGVAVSADGSLYIGPVWKLSRMPTIPVAA